MARLRFKTETIFLVPDEEGTSVCETSMVSVFLVVDVDGVEGADEEDVEVEVDGEAADNDEEDWDGEVEATSAFCSPDWFMVRSGLARDWSVRVSAACDWPRSCSGVVLEWMELFRMVWG